MLKYNLPPELVTRIGDEPIDFVVKAKKANYSSWYNHIPSFIFFIIWFGVIGTITFYVLQGNFNGTGSLLESFKKSAPILLFISIFWILGLWQLIMVLRSIIKSGPYFILTPKYLIVYSDKNTEFIPWTEFTGTINSEIKDPTTGYGNIFIQKRAEEKYSTEDSDFYVPVNISMVGIPNVAEIEQIIRKRIEESKNKLTQDEYTSSASPEEQELM